ncbi:MAG: right-handed parallel beta-helix repeat-containing protein [Deltaproteobacteria bacterium]|nr:right-handed parallel beta-helix repeat-containing protein [Deltaproteobacteria bacterium]
MKRLFPALAAILTTIISASSLADANPPPSSYRMATTEEMEFRFILQSALTADDFVAGNGYDVDGMDLFYGVDNDYNTLSDIDNMWDQLRCPPDGQCPVFPRQYFPLSAWTDRAILGKSGMKDQCGPQDSYRYAIAFMFYYLAIQQYHKLPAFGAATPNLESYSHKLKDAMNALIKAMIDYRAYAYWESTSARDCMVAPQSPRGSTCDISPDLQAEGLWDPIAKANIMYSGHLAHMIALYESLFGDYSWSQDGAIEFVRINAQGDITETVEYSNLDLQKLLYEKFVNGTGEDHNKCIQCERNLCFIQCNVHPLLALKLHVENHPEVTEPSHDHYVNFEEARDLVYEWIETGGVAADGTVGMWDSNHANWKSVWIYDKETDPDGTVLLADEWINQASTANNGWIGTVFHALLDDPDEVLFPDYLFVDGVTDRTMFDIYEKQKADKEVDTSAPGYDYLNDGLIEFEPGAQYTSVQSFAMLAAEMGDTEFRDELLAWSDERYHGTGWLEIPQIGYFAYSWDYRLNQVPWMPNATQYSDDNTILTDKLTAIARATPENGWWEMHNNLFDRAHFIDDVYIDSSYWNVWKNVSIRQAIYRREDRSLFLEFVAEEPFNIAVARVGQIPWRVTMNVDGEESTQFLSASWTNSRGEHIAELDVPQGHSVMRITRLDSPSDCVVRVDGDSPASAPDGMTWGGAFKTVQEGIDAAHTEAQLLGRCEVWVKEGTYYIFESGLDDTVTLKPGVEIYGGFGGTENNRNARSVSGYPTVLDGRAGAGSFQRVNHVVTGSDNAVIDGFTITGGKAHNAENVLFVSSGWYTQEQDFEDRLVNSGYSVTSIPDYLMTGSTDLDGYDLIILTGFAPNVSNAGIQHISVSGKPVFIIEYWDFIYSEKLGLVQDSYGFFGDNTLEVLATGHPIAQGLSSNFAAYNPAYYAFGVGAWNIESGVSLILGGPTWGQTTVIADEARRIVASGLHEPASYTPQSWQVFDNILAYLASLGGSEGAGMFNSGSSPVVRGCTFIGNEASRGGGMYNINSTPFITECRFEGNIAAGEGAGIYNDNSSCYISDVFFEDNVAGLDGAGIYNRAGELSLSSVMFTDNHADENGGAVFSGDSGDVRMTNCVFFGNGSNNGGALAGAGTSKVELLNCTFFANQADNQGGAVFNNSSSPVEVTNSILWNDMATIGSEILGSATVTHSDVSGGFTGEGNVDVDPLFLNAGAGVLDLAETSPCIDVADDGFAPGADYHGTVRYDMPGVGISTADMGAYEYYQ